MSNLINDKLFPADNAVFTPGEEISLRAYMEGRVGKFYTNFPDDGQREFNFIKGQTFRDLISTAETGASVCNVKGVFFIDNNTLRYHNALTDSNYDVYLGEDQIGPDDEVLDGAEYGDYVGPK